MFINGYRFLKPFHLYEKMFFFFHLGATATVRLVRLGWHQCGKRLFFNPLVSDFLIKTVKEQLVFCAKAVLLFLYCIFDDAFFLLKIKFKLFKKRNISLGGIAGK